eukprot:scaffold1476_cov264-Pinguiococcus_pyrenoidosus.AAC.3
MRAFIASTVVALFLAGCDQGTAKVARNQEKYLKRTGQKFLDDKAAEDGVYRLPSGLVIKILEKSDSDKAPNPTSRVSVHYHGTLKDGSVFDSSVERASPATFGVNQVISGWTEALQLMCEGDKWELYIPYDLAYGERGSPPKIGPYAPLVFEVEILDILDNGKPCSEARDELLEKLEVESYDEL